MSFTYTLVDDWTALVDARDARASALALKLSGGKAGTEARMLLFSDGSLTLGLEAYLGERVDIEVISNATARLPVDTALYLGEPAGSEALFREIWLRLEGGRLVFAHSAIPCSTMEDWLAEALRSGLEPLGRILSERGIPVLKEAIELASIKSETVAEGLGLPPDSEFIARRYLLINMKDTGQWVIKAAVIEVFSPDIVLR